MGLRFVWIIIIIITILWAGFAFRRCGPPTRSEVLEIRKVCVISRFRKSLWFWVMVGFDLHADSSGGLGFQS